MTEETSEDSSIRSKAKCANCKKRILPEDGELLDGLPWCYDCIELKEDRESRR